MVGLLVVEVEAEGILPEGAELKPEGKYEARFRGGSEWIKAFVIGSLEDANKVNQVVVDIETARGNKGIASTSLLRVSEEEFLAESSRTLETWFTVGGRVGITDVKDEGAILQKIEDNTYPAAMISLLSGEILEFEGMPVCLGYSFAEAGNRGFKLWDNYMIAGEVTVTPEEVILKEAAGAKKGLKVKGARVGAKAPRIKGLKGLEENPKEKPKSSKKQQLINLAANYF